ncbi:MAG: hypothetical protein NTW87_13385 [Planctomycetota bacterium]|nr:hypothetical protein [Planctomycetota bacterium]
MSIKQTIIVAFMIVFLATTLGTLGTWFAYSTQISTKDRMISVLEDRAIILRTRIKGTAERPGLETEVTNPLTGLGKQAKDAADRARTMLGDENSGAAQQRKVLYEAKEKELKDKMGELDAQGNPTADAQVELDRELSTEVVEKRKITEEKKKNQDEIGAIRAAQEQVEDKVVEVTRETRKTTAIVPQGRVISAAEDLSLVTVDVGRDHGVRKGLRFDVYSGAFGGLVKKAVIEITNVRAASSDSRILPAKQIQVVDPATGWVPTDERMKYSVFAAGGADETAAQELLKPKTRQERIEAYRLEKMERELGPEAKEKYLKELEQPSAPPLELGKGFVPILRGDWINNPNFVPIIPEQAYQKQTVQELLSMQDVNLSTLTFHFTDGVRPYRKEFLRRLCERNRCHVTDTMSADVSYVVTSAGMTSAEAVAEKVEPTKEKEEVSADIKGLRKTLAALLEAKKVGAHVISEGDMEGFFAQRQRKAELLRGKTIQPGRSTFYVAGDTKERSVAQTRAWIRDHGGVPVEELVASVDYVVVGAGLDQAFYDKIKKMGLKILREDELPRFFGLDR